MNSALNCSTHQTVESKFYCSQCGLLCISCSENHTHSLMSIKSIQQYSIAALQLRQLNKVSMLLNNIKSIIIHQLDAIKCKVRNTITNYHKLIDAQPQFLKDMNLFQYNENDNRFVYELKNTIQKALIQCESEIDKINLPEILSPEKIKSSNTLNILIPAIDITDSLEINLEEEREKFIRQLQNQIVKNIIQQHCTQFSLQKLLPLMKDHIWVAKVYPDNSHYMGFYSNENLRDGYGLQLWPNGAYYEGYWNKDKSNGTGTLIHPDGNYYYGKWKDDKQDGYGVETWQDGAKYDGEYVDGRKQGDGYFTWADNSSYKGQFNSNNIEGKGLYMWADGKSYDGLWKNNKMHGSGVFAWVDGRKYIGEYREDKKEGTGKMCWPDGRMYDGEWKDGKQHGVGVYISVNEKSIKGVWEFGKRVKNTDT